MSKESGKLSKRPKGVKSTDGTMPMREFRHRLKERMTKKAKNKQSITLRLDVDILERLKEAAGEGSYQSLINVLLRESLDAKEFDHPIARLEALATRIEQRLDDGLDS